MKTDRPRSSRQRYRTFVEDYKLGRLDELLEEGKDGKGSGEPAQPPSPPSPSQSRAGGPVRRGKRREYLREYLRWLRPYRAAVVVVFVLALLRAGLEMIEPLFMRFIVDRVLLDSALDTASRFGRLNLAGRDVPAGHHPLEPGQRGSRTTGSGS